MVSDGITRGRLIINYHIGFSSSLPLIASSQPMVFLRRLITALLLLCAIYNCSAIHCFKFEQRQQGGEVYKSAKVQVDCGDDVKYCWSLSRDDLELNIYSEDCPDMNSENGKCEEAKCRGDKDTKICCCDTDYCNSAFNNFATAGALMFLLCSLVL
ncbi:unnamed protein product [Auanema sp. JU1783]|nr:unnamed protein product [Auanema sp. JU1783]